MISIHAPTGGATSGRRLYVHVVDLFQSTLPRGERQKARYVVSAD